MKESQALKLHFFQPRDHADLTRSRAVSVDMGDAEISSTAHSERSCRTCAWSQQASHRSLSPKGLPTRDRFTDTVSTVKTVEQMHASPNRDQDRPVQTQDLAAYGTGAAVL